MLLHLGKTYYALEAKTMAREELLPSASWDLDCDCEPPPLFHLPPPPQPPGILGPLEHSAPEDCNGPWTCPALALEAGGTFGRYDEGADLKEASPEVPVPVIVVSASMLGLFLVVAAVIFVSRMWRTYKASSKKASCDLDGTDLYEDLPAAPPLLAPPRHPTHCPPPIRYKEELLPPPRGGLPPTPGLHLYSPEPRPDTPSDHLYHHISSAGSETCSCNTSEAPSNALLPTSLHLIHSEEDEASSSSSHSYSSSSTATPTSSPTPATMTHPCTPLYLCPTSAPPSNTYVPSTGALQYPAGKYKHSHNVAHPTSLQSTVYAVNPVQDQQQQQTRNMVPLAQIYSPGSHLYESATLIRPNANMVVPTCSMVHWGNVPATFVQAANSHQTIKPGNQYDARQLAMMIPMHNTMAHPLQYYGGQNGHGGHQCTAKHSPIHVMSMNQYPSSFTQLHHPHIHHYQPPTHLPLPLHSSTLIPAGRSNNPVHDGMRSPDDLTPTNSVPIDSIYNASPRSEKDLIATTCLSTVSSLPGENEYSTTLDAINLNSHPLLGHYNQEDALPIGGVSDTSSLSHPSNGSDNVMVTESSSLDSSGTTSSIIPLCNRPELPALPSRADRYRIYARNNDSGIGSRCSSYKRSHSNNINNNNAVLQTPVSEKSNFTDSISCKSTKSCDDLNNVSPTDNSRVAYDRDHIHFDANNVANNNHNGHNGNNCSYEGDCVSSKRPLEELDPPSPPEEFASRAPHHRRCAPTRGARLAQQRDEQEDDIYDNFSDT